MAIMFWIIYQVQPLFISKEFVKILYGEMYIFVKFIEKTSSPQERIFKKLCLQLPTSNKQQIVFTEYLWHLPNAELN